MDKSSSPLHCIMHFCKQLEAEILKEDINKEDILFLIENIENEVLIVNSHLNYFDKLTIK